MLSYDEVMDIYKNYRYKFDYDNKSYTLINSKTKEIQQPSIDTDKIKAALAAYKVLQSHYKHYPSVSDKSETEQIDWKKQKLEELQKCLSNIVQNGNYRYKDFYIQQLSIEQQFFNEILKEKEQNLNDSAADLMKYIAYGKGKKIEDISYEMEKSGMAYNFSWNVRDIPFTQQLNPKNPQYTQTQKTKQLSPEEIKTRRNFVDILINYYKMAETDTAYQDRVSREDENMKFVADTVNMNKQITFAKFGKNFMNRLMAAQNLSLKGQKDYLEELISQPAISDVLLQVRKSGRNKEIQQRAENNKINGILTNGKPKGHHETNGERCARFANNEISKNPSIVNLAKQKLTSNVPILYEKDTDSQRMVFVYSAIARTMGYIPSFKQDKSGNMLFTPNDGISR